MESLEVVIHIPAWVIALASFAVKLTPTKKDDAWLVKILKFLSLHKGG